MAAIARASWRCAWRERATPRSRRPAAASSRRWRPPPPRATRSLAPPAPAPRRRGLDVKRPADQLSGGGGAALAAQFDPPSADPPEQASEGGIKAMGNAKGVAVTLPGAFYYLRKSKKPPIDALRRNKVPMAGH